MAHELIVALSLILGASQNSGGTVMPTPPAPPGGPQTRYCLRVDPLPGSRIETVQCLTREQWAELGLDVDQEWAENGVRVIA